MLGEEVVGPSFSAFEWEEQYGVITENGKGAEKGGTTVKINSYLCEKNLYLV